jgi:hypothetical protein
MNNKKIIIKPVAFKKMRYPTVDDFKRDRHGNLVIKVVDFMDGRYFALIALHAFIESLLCEYAGVAETSITKFDKKFEASGKPGEPGDETDAPYKNQHCAAMGFERMFAAMLGVDWKTYEQKIAELFIKKTASGKIEYAPVGPAECEAGGKVDRL